MVRARQNPSLAPTDTATPSRDRTISLNTDGQIQAAGADRAAASAAGAWGRAIEVPGLGALNVGTVAEGGHPAWAQVSSMSCPSSGNCVAGGYSINGSFLGFLADQKNGLWGKAFKMPRKTRLVNSVTSVSCASTGNCVAAGDYDDAFGRGQGFVVDEKNGSWGKVLEVPGLAALNVGGQAQVNSISCASAGNCAAGGWYKAVHGQQAFVVSEHDGTWGTAIGVPGLKALNKGGVASVSSVSCPSAGYCAAAGSYRTVVNGQQAFLVSEHNGSWGRVFLVPGLAALNTGTNAAINSVSCASPRNCAAGGYYGYILPSTGFPATSGFVASERNGKWANAIEVPGLAAMNTSGQAQVYSVSCASAGNCAAGGYGFLVDERNGTWRKAIPAGIVGSVSCASPGNCAAGWLGFVVTETNGKWGRPIEVPGLAALNKGTDPPVVLSVSCAPRGNCAAGGYYVDTNNNPQGFVVNQRTAR
jgi:hypothetical protein